MISRNSFTGYWNTFLGPIAAFWRHSLSRRSAKKISLWRADTKKFIRCGCGYLVKGFFEMDLQILGYFKPADGSRFRFFVSDHETAVEEHTAITAYMSIKNVMRLLPHLDIEYAFGSFVITGNRDCMRLLTHLYIKDLIKPDDVKRLEGMWQSV